MFGFDSRREASIVRAEFKFQCAAADGETRLKFLYLGELPLIEIQLLMKKIVKRVRVLRTVLGDAPTDQHPRQRREEGNGRENQDPSDAQSH